jgi:hypothetical protein
VALGAAEHQAHGQGHQGAEPPEDGGGHGGGAAAGGGLVGLAAGLTYALALDLDLPLALFHHPGLGRHLGLLLNLGLGL